MTVRPNRTLIKQLILSARSWLLVLSVFSCSFFLCSLTVFANNHLKEPQSHCSDEHLKQHPQHILSCYLQKPDNNYHWRATETSGKTVSVADQKQEVITHSIEMTSQRWPVGLKHPVDHPLWRHRITIYQPKKVIHDQALLFINGGQLYSNKNEPLTAKQSPNDDLDFAYIAALSQSIVVDLKDVPNQYLQFKDHQPVKEDALVAYTWEEFLKNPEANAFMPLRLPMVKASQRAMDAVQAFMKGQNIKINQFVLSGMSKRGWAAWLTAAMDSRVIALAPMVADVLNLQAAMDHHYKSYGGWAPAVKDYKNVLSQLHSKPLTRLMQVVDPVHYVQNLRLPKYIISAANDDFFLPDASRYFYDDLKGDKWLRTVPNVRHYLARMENKLITESLASFYGLIIEQRPIPAVHWELQGNILKVTSSVPPESVRLWSAVNQNTRDFRLTPDNPSVKPFTAKYLTIKCNPICRTKASIANPSNGWKASFIEMKFANRPYKDFVVTTQVFITPDTYPSRSRFQDKKKSD
ncbi:hypothetical protein GZ77_18535 [Endozoicomonas montiporae]|uniref:PhoPQ-regulated protein n=2 Tax=Endozoicomonas montiporae TaxID=1027273 RepID=A0A081N241_9GAMM|nr:PhoPQ-activated protein PqaA family protein [Endozoicomonas montiporae]AMO58531.1 PhoPQ-activated pathogenicity-like protein [Endozoicomonas montiporae CL-33]KEQ12514.1 hypothetical protein GZ77_18535 [Endozoicomonas montiporae]